MGRLLACQQLTAQQHLTEEDAPTAQESDPHAEHIGVTAHRTRVFLPSNSPLPCADGAMMTGRRATIAAAALQACKELHQASVPSRLGPLCITAVTLPRTRAAAVHGSES